MGQAKRRGTREERVAKAIERNNQRAEPTEYRSWRREGSEVRVGLDRRRGMHTASVIAAAMALGGAYR